MKKRNTRSHSSKTTFSPQQKQFIIGLKQLELAKILPDLYSKEETDKIVMRLCKSIATIVLAGELANEYLGLSIDTEVMAKELIEVCISNVTDFREFAKTGNSADKLIEKFSGKINDLVGDNLEDVKELKMTADEFNSILKSCGMHETTLWKQSLIEKGYIERNHTNSGQVYHIKLEALNHD